MPPPEDNSLRFACPQCQAKLKVPRTLAGTHQRCPHCQMKIEVPWRTRAAPSETYPLQQGKESAADQPESVLVICGVCHTRMDATKDQIGQEIVCPDCGSPTLVSQPAETAGKKGSRSAKEVGDYPLAGEVDRTAGDLSAENFVAVLCPVCHTRMLATLDQVGGKLICPDCGSATVVPPPPPPRRKVDPMDEADEGYALVGWKEKSPIATAPPARESSPADDEPSAPEAEEPPLEPYSRPPKLPRRPFLSGTFSFPFASDARFHALLLAVWAMTFVGLAWKSIQLGVADEGHQMYLSALVGAAALLVAIMWFVVASACALALVRDTANGCDEIQNWPDMMFVDYLLEPLYIFDSWSLSVLLGIGLIGPLARFGLFGEAVAVVLPMFFLFPILLLSMLETGSPFGIISLPVWRSLTVAGRGWAAFYLTAAAMLVAADAIGAAALFIGRFYGIFVAAPILTVAWFIYFRLLGRLGWYCADRMRQAEQEAESDDEDTDDDIESSTAPEEVEMVPVTFSFCPRCARRVEIGRLPIGAKISCAACGCEFAVGASPGGRDGPGQGRGGKRQDFPAK